MYPSDAQDGQGFDQAEMRAQEAAAAARDEAAITAFLISQDNIASPAEDAAAAACATPETAAAYRALAATAREDGAPTLAAGLEHVAQELEEFEAITEGYATAAAACGAPLSAVETRELTAAMDAPLTDTQALDAIAALLDGQEHDGDTSDGVARIVRRTGREVHDVVTTDRCPDCGCVDDGATDICHCGTDLVEGIPTNVVGMVDIAG